MDKYKTTSGLNYLSENSYKGDGSPGMVMGIASDARGDTNTNEAQKPTTSSKHSTERELKKYDPAHGHSKPEGGNPNVCPNCKGEGCEPCGDTGEVISKKRNDPKVDEALDDIKRLSGLTEAFAWDEIDEAKRKKRKERHDLDDDDEEEKPEDPEKDKVQHILMQLRKAKDVDGDHPIKFLDGSEVILPIKDIDEFMQMYMNVKPQDRERLQQVAIMSKDKFDKLLTFFTPKHGKMEKSIYEDEEMISESQFDEAAGEKDACYHKVKSRYKVWPSAYASGALVKCRKVGASNWGTGGKKKK
tara:strand:+ start:5283 stop:6185 length:903 start_codon:yes stop_codon:yes gene_type:complete